MQSSENRTGEKSLAKSEWEHIFIWCLENIELWLWLCGVGLLLATLSIRGKPPARQCHRLRSGKQETELSEARYCKSKLEHLERRRTSLNRNKFPIYVLATCQLGAD